MSITFDITRVATCRMDTHKFRQVRAEQGDLISRAVCFGRIDACVAELEFLLGPVKAAEAFYRAGDNIVAREHDRLTGNQSSGLV